MGHAPNTLQALEAAAAAHAEEMAGARASYEVQAEALQREALTQLTDMRHLHEKEVQLMTTEHAEALQQAQVGAALHAYRRAQAHNAVSTWMHENQER